MQKMLAMAAVLMLAAPAAWAQGHADRLAAADANHDGSITRAEMEAARAAMFDRIDANHDGAISAEEHAAAAQARRMEQRRRHADPNNDGVISRAEFMDRQPRAFERFDANHNDVLEPSELEALRTMAQRFGR